MSTGEAGAAARRARAKLGGGAHALASQQHRRIVTTYRSAPPGRLKRAGVPRYSPPPSCLMRGGSG